ncbi:MAG: prepilin-type N-terminal cleavage/methylation domain-containing protein [Synergistaceae bacterium]|nr:prepilin-type N-terminal cleavage/methylation domain-containing protein [Synergistaceae bacterium]
MRKIDKGFSLVELLIAILIIGVLAGFLFLMMETSGDKAKKEVCHGNRVTILRALDIYRLSNALSKENYNLQNFINDKYKETLSNNDATCPSGGVYSAGEENGKEFVVCSIHSVTPGGGEPSGNVIPGTGGIVAGDGWEETITGENSISFNIGQKFLHEGEYYVAVETLSNIYFLTDNDPEMNTSKWWTTKSGGGLVQFTEVRKDWDNVNMGDTFKRGDVVLYNGDYYVCVVQGYSGIFTANKNADNNNHPASNDGKWAWYKLNN